MRRFTRLGHRWVTGYRTQALHSRAPRTGRRRGAKPVLALRTITAAVIAAMLAGGVLASSAGARATAPACPDTVIPNGRDHPDAVGCWNAIAVHTVTLAAPYNVQGLIYMGYVQAAVYDAVTKIDGRYVPYHGFSAPSGVDLASASPDAAAAAATYTCLAHRFWLFRRRLRPGS